MNLSLADNPKVTYALCKLEDILQEQSQRPHPDFTYIKKHKPETLARYQPIFSSDHIPKLTRAEFESFLLFRNNHHWNNLHRVGKYMTEDIQLLRQALLILIDENRPVQDRLNELRPERMWGEHSMVSHMGMPVLTAILQVIHPDLYGVWNNTSDQGLKKIRLWNDRWDLPPAGNSYLEMNTIFLYLADALHVDLWTLDALWWVMRTNDTGFTITNKS